MWLLSCSRQGMLTEGPAPNCKCKLIILSFITFLHLLDCLICTRNAMSTVLLLQLIGDGLGGGWLLYIRVWVWEQGLVSSYSFFGFSVFAFCSLTFSVLLFRWLEHDGCLSVSSFFLYFLSLVFCRC